MDPRDLRKKELNELQEMEQKLEDSVIESYLDIRTGKEDDVRKPRRKRKDLAVLKTVISEKKKAKLNSSKKDAK
jgi:ribosomal protein L29